VLPPGGHVSSAASAVSVGTEDDPAADSGFHPGYLELRLMVLPSRAAVRARGPCRAARATSIKPHAGVAVAPNVKASTEAQAAADGAGRYVFRLPQKISGPYDELVIDLNGASKFVRFKERPQRPRGGSPPKGVRGEHGGCVRCHQGVCCDAVPGVQSSTHTP
jgi:hypothetical protein